MWESASAKGLISKIRMRFHLYYQVRSSNWFKQLYDTDGLMLDVECIPCQPAEDFPLELINYSNAIRALLADMKGWLFREFPDSMLIRISLLRLT